MINFKNDQIREKMETGFFGLEKESLRVNTSGYIASTSHPFGQDGVVDRDFCESQVELITPVCESTEQVYASLRDAHRYVSQELLKRRSGKEYLWKFSNPPCFVEEKVKIAKFTGSLKYKNEYRNYLAHKYGKQMMLYSGIHYNFSFTEELLTAAYEEEKQDCSYQEYKNNLYLQLSAAITKYSWLIVFLTAASPVFDLSLRYKGVQGVDGFENMASMRNSQYGYWNTFTPTLDYTSLDRYVKSMDRYVEDKILFSPAEVYLPVRIKPAGANTMDNLKKRGIGHIELRMLDLNPLEEVGISIDDLDFLHYFIVYLASGTDRLFSEHEQIAAIENHKAAAAYDTKSLSMNLDGSKKPLEKAAAEFLTGMREFYRQHDNAKAIRVTDVQLKKVHNSDKRYAVQVYQKYGRHYVETAMEELTKTRYAVCV